MESRQPLERIRLLARSQIGGKPTFDVDGVRNRISLVGALDFAEADLAENRELMESFAKECPIKVRTINWFIPYFNFAFYGGIHNIFRFADYYQTFKGVESRFILYDRPDAAEQEIRSKIAAAFPRLQSAPIHIKRESDINTMPECDVAIATLWTSAFSLLKFRKTKGKFYFIQDYEPLFYPAGTLYALAESTYRFGFYGIISTPGLYQFYASRQQIPSEWWVPAVDRKIFFPPRLRPQDKFRVLFYGRPETDRNAFEIGMQALRAFKNRYGDKVELFTVGSPQLSFFRYDNKCIKNLGLLSYRATADLYRACDAGLAMMVTPHPSLLPMELMASATAVVQNYNPHNTWLLKDRENCLITEPTTSCICEKLELLMHDASLRSELTQNGLKTISRYKWEEEMEKIFKFISEPTGKLPARFETEDSLTESLRRMSFSSMVPVEEAIAMRLRTFDLRLNELSSRVDQLQDRLNRYLNLPPIRWMRRLRAAIRRLPPPP